MDIADRVVLITGGGSGMGAATAQFLRKKGAKIAILDQNISAAQEVAEKVQGFAVACDVRDANSTELALNKVTEQFGPARVCINCAGIAPAKRIVGRDGPMALNEFEHVIQINLVGTFNVLRLAAALMAKLEPVDENNERGVIINTASIAAFEGQIGQSAYSASKAGVCGLTLPAARELAQFNIRVMTIAPGLIKTPMLDTFPEEIQKNLTSNILFPHRFGLPEEYAKLVGHIIENAYLNGEVVRLDAGLRMPPK